jgi:hypothetical protein
MKEQLRKVKEDRDLAQLKMEDREMDECEVARCSCGLVFYSTEYALEHVCLGGSDTL